MPSLLHFLHKEAITVLAACTTGAEQSVLAAVVTNVCSPNANDEHRVGLRGRPLRGPLTSGLISPYAAMCTVQCAHFVPPIICGVSSSPVKLQLSFQFCKQSNHVCRLSPDFNSWRSNSKSFLCSLLGAVCLHHDPWQE